MTIIRTTDAADKVLAAVEGLAPATPDLYLEPYQNGREHGWALSCHDCKVAFAEDRNTDLIVVYAGKIGDFALAGNVPDGKAYDARNYFVPEDVDEAARHILATLIPA